MMQSRILFSALSAAVCFVAAPATVRAQAVPAACKPLFDAELKEITTPHHAYSSDGPPGEATKARTGETIFADGANYLLYKGQWRRSPMTSKMQLDQMRENIATAKAVSCRRIGQEMVGGIAADVYSTHTDGEDRKSDARTWVAKSSGLVLRTEEDIDSGMDKRHISIRYEYSNVHAPSVVR